MNTPRVTITVTGHHVNKAITAQQAKEKLRQPILTFANAFAEALADEVGVEVSSLIGSGRWWTSKHPRFAYYRAWVKTRYGSDRARKSGGSKRQLGSSSIRPHDEGTNPGGLSDSADIGEWGNIQHLTMQWLIRKLRSVSLPAYDAQRRPIQVITSTKTGSTAIDVTAAIAELEKVAAKNKHLTDGAKLDARARRKRNLDELLGDTSLVSRTLKESRYGQKLLRQAELAAVRELRARQAAKAGSTTGKRRKSNSAGSFKWGVQTGTLRDAWLDTSWKKTFNGQKLSISIMPSNKSSQINAWRLTQILQAKIARAGGNPRLLRPTASKRVVRTALEEALKEVEMRGVSVRLKSK